ncbi:hypothetical protein WAI453_012419 [Rhynchosporium graminicola]
MEALLFDFDSRLLNVTGREGGEILGLGKVQTWSPRAALHLTKRYAMNQYLPGEVLGSVTQELHLATINQANQLIVMARTREPVRQSVGLVGEAFASTFLSVATHPLVSVLDNGISFTIELTPTGVSAREWDLVYNRADSNAGKERAGAKVLRKKA